MNRTTFIAIFVFAATLVQCAPAWSQATVNENLETAFVYVDATKGSDSNPGTQQLPLKTVGAGAALATTNNQAGIGTRVIINPGTYREAVTISSGPKTTSLPITFQAATTGTAIISGADVWTGWKAYGSKGVYTNSWPYTWGLCAADVGNSLPEEDIARRSEMIFVSGQAMTQVLSQTAMRQSTFYVDQTHAKVYLWPPSGVNPNTATTEVATRPVLFTTQKMANLVLRGLTFQYANTCRGYSAAQILGDSIVNNVLIDTDFFYWNNAAGLRLIDTTDTPVQNSVGNHNGVTGLEDFDTLNALWQNKQTSFNGWRGALAVYYNWGSAGTHFGGAHSQTLKNITSAYNQTFGFHWDTDNENDNASALMAQENELAGAFVEKSQGPLTISNSVLCSGSPSTGVNNIGFELRNSENVSLTGSSLYNNLQAAIVVTGQAGGIPITNWQTGQTYNLISQNTVWSNNTVDAAAQLYVLTDGTLGGSDWSTFQSTLNSDYNTWWNSLSSNAKPFSLPVPANWTGVNFAGWQAATGQDSHSTWSQPSSQSCNATVDAPDYWFITNALLGYQSVNPGSSVNFVANMVPLNFTGTATLSSDGLQGITGMSGGWSPSTMTGSSSATFTVKTSSSTPAGSYPITLLATSGNVTRSMTITVTVK